MSDFKAKDIIELLDSVGGLPVKEERILIMHTEVYEGIKDLEEFKKLKDVEIFYANYVPTDKVYLMPKTNWESLKPNIQESIHRMGENL